ncbi:hypothetical protein RN001_015447 [Aquatica leii]|uniref:Small nuclear ribonucleoprotein Sm D2 n=1 Tax=Aquatica leii TaxID=1421715 RepID=A0AAN7SL72_9COLE|nr:hypothetical protein RN001_015447 [Aquatica leii]
MTQTQKADKDFQIGPMSILQDALNNHNQVLISCRNNKKLLGFIKAYDRHMNLILENVKEMWTELPRKGKGKCIAVTQDRFLPKLFVRGDCIIVVVAKPVKKNDK